MVTFGAQNSGNGISGLQISKLFQVGVPPDPPSYATSLNMLRSDFWLDPPRVLSDVQFQKLGACEVGIAQFFKRAEKYRDTQEPQFLQAGATPQIN